jgi:nitrogen fixation/metabolism regulation signal transduction histidine kinase
MQTLLGDPNESVMTRLKKESGEFILLGVILLSLFPAFLLDTVRFSNRFVGPIARLRRGLRELGENREAEKMIFRDSDFWTDVAGEYNQVREIIQSQSEEIEKLKRKLEAAPVE